MTTAPLALNKTTLHLTSRSVPNLLALYAGVLEELRVRKIIRSSNNPVADYSEVLCEKAFSWRSAEKSTKGYDATDSRGKRYQIKGRRLTRHSRSRQLGVLRDLNDDPFDYLVGIIFSEDFRVFRACRIPISTLRSPGVCQYIARTNSWRFVLNENVWELPGAIDLTPKLKTAQKDNRL